MNNQQINIPKLRFPEFKDVWKSDKLYNLLQEGRLGGNYENSESNKGIPVIKMGNIGRGNIILDKIQYLPEEIKYCSEDILKAGDLLFNTRNTLDLVGKVAIWNNDLKYALYNSNLLRIKFNNNFEGTNRFMNYFFNTRKTINQLRSFATGTTSVAAIYMRDLNQLKISFPSLPEQSRIASFFFAIDEKLKLETQRLASLKQYKKGVMQKLFTQELRFKDENGNEFPDWEVKKLGEIAYKKSSNIAANTIEDNIGDFVIYGASGEFKKVDFYKEEEEYISIVKDGAGVGRVFLCEAKSSVLGTLDIIKSIGGNLHYLFYFLQQTNFLNYVTGSTIPHIYFSDYKKEKIVFPCLNEQTKIANFLSAIDDKINQTENKLNKMQTYKKGLLQQMFV